ncbi:MAG: Asp-tRNA(Asn)/Glu-tRNA(Gln) amidotransferase subunit GatB [Candidatus Peregrinibacteria bacterium]
MTDHPQYESVMGLEIHARLKTKTKMFCNCSNDTWKARPNEHICPVCAGFPGALPVANTEAVRLGRKMGLALGCSLRKLSKFDRKSYFYPDLPSGFQISQYDEPVCEKGKLRVIVNGEEKFFGITRLHLENDAGKLTHSGTVSLVDWNRAGSPLAEMVTEPDFRTPTEVSSFLRELQRILRLCDISDADMEKGMMRCDVNVSVRPRGQEKLGTKVEMKNMNSFRNIEKALEYEIARQIKLCEEGRQAEIKQETRGWDDEKGKTTLQRSKEEAMDYRYFPEPDLPPLTITEAEIEALQNEIPELPAEKILRFLKDGISFTDADILVNDGELTHFYEAVEEACKDPKKAANWVLGALMSYINEHSDFQLSSFSPSHLAALIRLIDEGTISGKIAKEIFEEVVSENTDPKALVEKKGLVQMSNAGELESICQKVLTENATIVEDYRGGKEKAFAALVGKTMAATKGQANPQMVNGILKKLLSV